MSSSSHLATKPRRQRDKSSSRLWMRRFRTQCPTTCLGYAGILRRTSRTLYEPSSNGAPPCTDPVLPRSMSQVEYYKPGAHEESMLAQRCWIFSTPILSSNKRVRPLSTIWSVNSHDRGTSPFLATYSGSSLVVVYWPQQMCPRMDLAPPGFSSSYRRIPSARLRGA